MGLIGLLIVGAIAGWLANYFMKSNDPGIVNNILIGVGGAFIGGLVFKILGFHATHFFGQLITATVGASILLYFLPRLKT